MYNLFLIDDEDEVREGMMSRTDWARFGFRPAGAFGNGKDALEALETAPPDLIITDVCMPYMDGLELAAVVAERYRDVKVVILTGYEDFDYAQRAIRSKVHDYLLKPINFRELSALLNKLRRELDEERRQKEDLGRLRIQLQESLPLLREKFLEKMVTSRLSREEIDRKCRLYGLSLPGPAYVALVLDAEGGSPERFPADDTGEELLRFASANIVREIFESGRGGIVFRTKEEKLAVLFSGSEAACSLDAQRLAEETGRCIGKYLHARASFGIGRVCSEPGELSRSYAEALSALDYRFLLGAGRIICIQDMERGERPAGLSYGEWEHKLLRALRVGNAPLYRETLAAWVRELKRTAVSAEMGYTMILRFHAAVLDLLEEAGIPCEAVASAQPFARVLALKTLDEAECWLRGLGDSAIERLVLNRSQAASAQLRQAEAYILEHYADENLSLGEVSQHVYMSMNYFSALFKQQRGESFVEFLTRVRLDKAKELLLATSLKTYEIASRVGYGDPQYFSVIFKRHVGMTPKQYRASAGKGVR